jgi:hypothetical protein
VSQTFDVSCLGGGVAGVIQPFPAFNLVLGARLGELAGKVVRHIAARG